MQYQLPMAEVHAFWETRGPGRIESRRLRILVEIRKVIIGGSGSQQILVFACEFDFTLGGLWPVGQDDAGPHLIELRFDALQESDELVVDQEYRRAGMIDGVGDLFGRQPHVYGLQDGAHHRYSEECLQK